MQKLKSDIQKTILDAAEYLFTRKGYKNTSMREIATKADVGLSNIYNYFSNKDEIFRHILQPVVDELYHMIYNHDAEKVDLSMFTDSGYQKKEIEQYMDLAGRYRKQLKLLLFHVQGSSLGNFREDFTNEMTRVIDLFFKELKVKYPYLNIRISDFFVHLNTAWLFTMLEELVMHHIKKDDMKIFISEYIAFETAGWKELMHA